MKAGVMVEPEKIEIREVKTPDYGDNEVLIKVKYCGICGTDIHIYNGVYSRDKLPLIPGHEFVGTVAAAGPMVKNLSEGDTVLADINLGCGSCKFCKQNKPLLCSEMSQIGIHRDGAFAEYVSVPASYVVKLDEGVPLDQMALVEPLSCCVRTFRLSNVSFAKSLVIVGGGSMGLLLVQMAKLAGAAPVIMAARRQETLDMAVEMGADRTVLLGDGDVEKVRELTEGYGADYVIEAVGKPQTYAKAVDMVGPGGKLIAFGLMGDGESVPMEFLKTVLQEQSVSGACAGAGSDITDAVRLVENGRFNLSRYTENILPLDKIADGFNLVMNDKSVLKVLIDVEQQ